MKKIVNLGKIDANDTGRKINKAELEVRLEMRTHGDMIVPVFTVCGSVWNSRNTDIIMGGQCLDSMLPTCQKNPLFMKIYRWWKLYHLNDMNAGTPAQERIIKDHFKITETDYDYYEAVQVLTDVGMYTVPVKPTDWWRTGKKEPKDGVYEYRYGSGWWYNDIPDADLKEIEEFINDN